MMFKEMLRLGKEPPEFIAEAESVRVLLRNATFDEQFAAFAEDRSQQGTPLSLDQLLILSYLKRHLELDRAKGVTLLQRSEREVSEKLTTMVRGELLERRGTGGGAVYQLSAPVAEKLGLPPRERVIDSIRCEEMVLRYVEEKGSVRNYECRSLCGLSPRQALYLLARLVEMGKLEKRGHKRGTYYVLPASG
jgi:ATP-dependent DNA helicase RecG